jgi:hypothetical protein
MSNYTVKFTPSTVTIPMRSGPIDQDGILVSVKRGDEYPETVLFLHESLTKGDRWVVAHASGFTIGFPEPINEAEARGLAIAALADDEIRATICNDTEQMKEVWPGSFAQDRLCTLCSLVGDEQTRQEEEAFFASEPSVEALIERMEEHPELVELELHDEEDRYLEWVEERSDEEKAAILQAIWQVYGEQQEDTKVYDLCPGIVEPGYTDRPFAIGDWWLDSQRTGGHLRISSIGKLLEACGADYGFDDEWIACSECSRAVRTQPDSYHWKRSYFDFDGDRICSECLEEDPSDYIEALVGRDDICHTMDSIDLTDHGFMQVWGEFASGLYGGQMDSPQAIARAFEDRDWDDFIFSLDSVGQFDAHFTVYLRVTDEDGEPIEGIQFVAEVSDPNYSWRSDLLEDEQGEVRVFATPEAASEHGTVYVWPNFDPGETHAGEDPAKAIQRGLQAASQQMAEVRSEADATGGVVYSKIHDGTASTRVVPRKEFIAGIND